MAWARSARDNVMMRDEMSLVVARGYGELDVVRKTMDPINSIPGDPFPSTSSGSHTHHPSHFALANVGWGIEMGWARMGCVVMRVDHPILPMGHSAAWAAIGVLAGLIGQRRKKLIRRLCDPVRAGTYEACSGNPGDPLLPVSLSRFRRGWPRVRYAEEFDLLGGPAELLVG